VSAEFELLDALKARDATLVDSTMDDLERWAGALRDRLGG
jgi:hypothetical protein